MKVNSRPIDIATLIYISFQILMISIFMIGKRGWYFILLFYLAAAGIAFIFMIIPISGNGSIWRALRITYPLFLLAFLYQAVGTQIFMIFDQPFDSHIHAFEKSIFGNDPAFALQPYMEIWLNEIMSLACISFYLIIPAAWLLLYFRRRWQTLERVALASATAFFICLVLFILLPTVGPRFFLYDHYYLPIIGPVISPLAEIIAAGNGFYGAALPSSHCALALVAVSALWGEFAKTRFFSAVFLLLLCAASVYCRYYYVTGVIAGLITGCIGLWVAGRWEAQNSSSREIDPGEISPEER